MPLTHYYSRLAALVLLILAAAMGAAASTVQLSESTGDLKGTITDNQGDALANAFVQVIAGPELGTERTNADGKFRLEDLEPGSYEIVARKQGYNTIRRRNVEIAANAETESNFELEWSDPTTGGLEATITGPQGILLPDSTVDLLANGIARAQTTTDAAGIATFVGLPRGFYRLAASRSGFFPSTSGDISVRPKQMTTGTVKLRLDPQQAGRISGSIQSTDGTSIRTATVRVSSGFNSVVEVTARGGNYEVTNLVPGDRYRVEVSANNFATQTQGNVVVRAQQLTVVDMVLVPNVPNRGSLTGLVENLAGQPLPFATVTITTGPDLLRHTQTDTDGRYTFPDLRPSPGVGVTVEQDGFYPVGANGLTITAGRTTVANFRLKQLTVDAGSIRGRVRDSGSGRPLNDVVIAITEGPSAGRAGVTDGSGVYEFPGLEAGSYTLTFTRADYQSEVRSLITVNVGAETVVNVDMTPREISTGSITGTVRRSASQIVKSVTVTLFEGPSAPLETKTDTRGNYSFKNLQPGGDYAIRFEKARFVKKELTNIDVADGKATRVDVTLTPKKQIGTLAGRVLDLGQQPIENAFVRILEGPENPGEVRTNEDGEFIFEALRGGTYRIEAGANGFRSEQRPSIHVSPRRTTRVTFTLLR